jgi:ferritin-like metal-binding protein YciE
VAGISNTQEKFLHELGDIYDAEQQFLKGQQEMLQQASDPTLKQMLERHIGESEGQVQVLEQVFEALGEKPKRESCAAAKGLVTEAQKVLKEAQTPELRDCLIGGSAAKVEHYEIASYRGLIIGAQQMGQDQVVSLLEKNLQQEEQTAQKVEQSAPLLLQKAMQAETSTVGADA